MPRDADDACRWWRTSGRRRWSPTSSRSPPRSPPSFRRAGRDAHPPCRPALARRGARRTPSARGCPRTASAGASGGATGPLVERGLRARARRAERDAPAPRAAPARAACTAGISEELCLVATFPQLEYPRRWPPGTHVMGPLLWEPASRRRRAAARGRAARARRAVDVPGSRPPAAARGAGRARGPARPRARHVEPPPAARAAGGARERAVVEWVSYARTMPRCDVVVCHGGHGTVARALASGCASSWSRGRGHGENAARIDWARRRRARAAADVHAAGDAAGRRPGAREARAAATCAGGVRLGRDARCAVRAAGLVERFARG